MNRTKLDKYFHNLSLPLGVLLLLLLGSCSSTKYVPQDQYLLRKVKLSVDNRNISKDEMRSYVRQRPNKTILGATFHLWLYSRSNIYKDSKWHEWLRKNGEEPVIWNEGLTRNSVQQLTLYMNKKGYYHAHVADTAHFKGKKVVVEYRIRSGDPYIVRSVDYEIEDSRIRSLVYADSIHTLVRPGIILDEDVLQQENNRLALLMKNEGYYSFSEQNVHYRVDTARNTLGVDLTLQINNPEAGIFPRYRMGQIVVDAHTSSRRPEVLDTTMNVRDTLLVDGVTFVMDKHFPVKPATMAPLVLLHRDSLFRQVNHDRTHRLLTNLNTFQMVNIDFTERTDEQGNALLNARINLIPFRMQSYAIEVEGTNSSGNLGGAVNLVYQHKSLFGKAEIFDLRLSGMMEALHQNKLNFSNTTEYGIEAEITVPKFLAPFRLNRFVARLRPTTSFSAQYSYQKRPDYQRTLLKAALAYNWRSGQFSSHSVRPVDVNYVRLPYASESFQNQIAGTYLENSYTNHLVPSGAYIYQYNNQSSTASSNFMYVRFSAETAGFITNTLFRMITGPKDDPYKIFGNQFSQFFKTDIDLRYYKKLGNNTLVYRFFAGIGVPYGNSRSIPFERKYYVGGANSNRGWQVRTLGPGSYMDTIPRLFPNSTGDVKLEANIEYRFKLLWIVESALFVDAGNVWDLQKEERRPGAHFAWDRFYREIGVSAGFGLRFDFQYFIIRTDLGMKLRDPARHRWVSGTDVARFRNTQFHIGIGYPF